MWYECSVTKYQTHGQENQQNANPIEIPFQGSQKQSPFFACQYRERKAGSPEQAQYECSDSCAIIQCLFRLPSCVCSTSPSLFVGLRLAYEHTFAPAALWHNELFCTILTHVAIAITGVFVLPPTWKDAIRMILESVSLLFTVSTSALLCPVHTCRPGERLTSTCTSLFVIFSINNYPCLWTMDNRRSFHTEDDFLVQDMSFCLFESGDKNGPGPTSTWTCILEPKKEMI